MNRHERRLAAKRVRQVEVPARALPRVTDFLNAFWEAPNDADIEIRGGTDPSGVSGLLVSISGHGEHVLLTSEARKIADIFEDAMRAHPDHPDAAALPNIIMCLRAACDKAA